MPSLRPGSKDRIMEKAGSLLEPLVKRLGIESGVRLSRIRADWNTLFDKTLSLHMSPSRLSDGELLLNVDSPVWLQQLNFYKSQITAKLSGYGIRGVRFRIGKVSPVRVDKEKRPRLPELSSEEAYFIEGLVNTISDAEIRNAVRGAAEKSLRTKKKEQT